jgi:hypothetical protein
MGDSIPLVGGVRDSAILAGVVFRGILATHRLKSAGKGRARALAGEPNPPP